jgi:hypothetical protein
MWKHRAGLRVCIHGEAELTSTSRDDKSSYLGVYVFIVFYFGEIGVVVGHRVQGVSTRRLSEQDGKDL